MHAKLGKKDCEKRRQLQVMSDLHGFVSWILCYFPNSFHSVVEIHKTLSQEVHHSGEGLNLEVEADGH